MSKSYYKNSLKFKVLDYIRKIPGNIVLRQDIKNIGSPRQISRCFKDLVEMRQLVKIGYGVYAKTYISKYIKQPVIKNGFDEACKEALTKLGVQWETGSAEQAYNAGLSTQVPVRTVVRLKSRYRGQLKYNNRKLIVENGVNAK